MSLFEGHPPITKRQSTLSSSIRSGNYLSVPGAASRNLDQSVSASEGEDDEEAALHPKRPEIPIRPTRHQKQSIPFNTSEYQYEERLVK